MEISMSRYLKIIRRYPVILFNVKNLKLRLAFWFHVNYNGDMAFKHKCPQHKDGRFGSSLLI